MVWLPKVNDGAVNVARPLPSRFTVATGVPSTLKLAVPVGVAALGAAPTVAVNVAGDSSGHGADGRASAGEQNDNHQHPFGKPLDL